MSPDPNQLPHPRARIRLMRLGLAVLSAALALVVSELAVMTWVPVRNVGATFTQYDRELGKRLKSSFTTVRTTPEFTMRLTTNSEGWRGPEFTPSPAGSVVCLGDSFTLGFGVDDGSEYPRLLERSLREELPGRAPAVMNLGIGNSGNGRWVKLIERGEIERYAPGVVILQVCSNDWEDNLEEGLFVLDADGVLVEPPIPPPGAARRIQQVVESLPGLDRSWLMGLLRQSITAARRGRAAEAPAPSQPQLLASRPPGSDLLEALLRRSISGASSRAARVIVLAADLADWRLSQVAGICSEAGVELIQMPCKAERPDLYYRVDSHWNSAGHSHAAALLSTAIVEQARAPGDIPPRSR